MSSDSEKKSPFIPGAAVGGSVIVGIVATIAGLTAVGKEDWVGGGACFIGAALAFGLLANAAFRD